jgi:hypothetical protein
MITFAIHNSKKWYLLLAACNNGYIVIKGSKKHPLVKKVSLAWFVKQKLLEEKNKAPVGYSEEEFEVGYVLTPDSLEYLHRRGWIKSESEVVLTEDGRDLFDALGGWNKTPLHFHLTTPQKEVLYSIYKGKPQLFRSLTIKHLWNHGYIDEQNKLTPLGRKAALLAAQNINIRYSVGLWLNE